ncbi:MAG: elongation factor P [Candidatus Handelsmanbacteria bacterium RIFCSPLOWO2_12_FULL_64_10]|uniref:Elongation factor P n=1 Tax=Handelsmanbacteria sp. (strain RIFCSPLOWO2_12_FULL_64_10) TaxID=1817868 RepID=A0A1F6D5B5_HANXR|nr:MAG: elongation factor P [Candidatus Handelsmanbacteria bacterium RIFCSPLOWO2_12_FULL_64_10]
MVSTAEFRNGLVINHEGQLYAIVEFQHVKPGKGVAFVRTRLKNVRTGAVITPTFRSGDKVEDVRLERREMQYLYASDGFYHFMDTRTYEQIQFTEETVSNVTPYLKENDVIEVITTEDGPIGVEMPTFTVLTVTHTEPGIRGDTATGGTKPATLETGLTVQVPLFVNVGEKLKIDTRTGTYVERA